MPTETGEGGFEVPDANDPYEFLLQFAEKVGTDLEGEIRAKNHDPRKIEHSICDIIDNSIDAGATKVEITIAPQSTYISDDGTIEENDFLYLKDNGKGIESENLRNIIRFYNNRDYQWWELGSFGIGLKDSLLAHGKEITVVSKAEGCEDFAWLKLSTAMARKDGENWVLVHSEVVGEALPEELRTFAFEQAISDINNMEKGTIVILENTHRSLLDGRQDDDEDDERLAGIQMEDTLKEWIALTFSDYLEGIDIGPRTKENPIEISLNGNPIIPLDPFMKNQVGIGDFNGQQGTFVEGYPFTYNGMDFHINRYILPNEAERASRIPGHDDRMITATRRGNPRLQGIYIKRNGRILDGPWNDSWRFLGHGMGYSHNTNCRWELILPSSSIEDFDLVTPDKREVDLSAMVSDLRIANREKIQWHEQDEFPYGPRKTGEPSAKEAQYNHRGRSRNNSNDIILICQHEGCNERRIPFTSEYCEAHQIPLCAICRQPVPLNSDGWCQTCVQSICINEDCNALKIQNSDLCLACSQPECTIEECSNLQLVQSEYCSEHEASVCLWVDCREQRTNGFNVCRNHRSIQLGNHTVELCSEDRSASLLTIDGSLIKININNPEYISLKGLLSTEG